MQFYANPYLFLWILSWPNSSVQNPVAMNKIKNKKWNKSKNKCTRKVVAVCYSWITCSSFFIFWKKNWWSTQNNALNWSSNSLVWCLKKTVCRFFPALVNRLSNNSLQKIRWQVDCFVHVEENEKNIHCTILFHPTMVLVFWKEKINKSINYLKCPFFHMSSLNYNSR